MTLEQFAILQQLVTLAIFVCAFVISLGIIRDMITNYMQMKAAGKNVDANGKKRVVETPNPVDLLVSHIASQHDLRSTMHGLMNSFDNLKEAIELENVRDMSEEIFAELVLANPELLRRDGVYEIIRDIIKADGGECVLPYSVSELLKEEFLGVINGDSDKAHMRKAIEGIFASMVAESGEIPHLWQRNEVVVSNTQAGFSGSTQNSYRLRTSMCLNCGLVHRMHIGSIVNAAEEGFFMGDQRVDGYGRCGANTPVAVDALVTG